MYKSITDQKFSREQFLLAVNDALSVVDGYKRTDNLSYIREALKHFPKIRDDLYSSAGATLNPYWISEVWNVCDVSKERIVRSCLALDNSTNVIKAVLQKCSPEERDTIAVNCCEFLGTRKDFLTVTKLLKEDIFSSEQFVKGTQKTGSPSLYALKVRSFGVISNFDVFDTIRRNANLRETAIFLREIKPNKAILNWASQRFKDPATSNRHLLWLVSENPRYNKYVASIMSRYKNAKGAFEMFRIGQGLHPEINNPDTISAFKAAMPLAEVERITLAASDVEVAVKMVNAGYSEASLSAACIRHSGNLDKALDGHDDLLENRDKLFDTLFSVELGDKESVGIQFLDTDSGMKAKLNASFNDDRDNDFETNQLSPHSQLSPD